MRSLCRSELDEIARKIAAFELRAAAREQQDRSRQQRWEEALSDRDAAALLRSQTREMRAQKCGARTRKGTLCQCKGLGRGRRCKFHGGMSTGPRTEAGKRRIADANRRRAANKQTVHEGSESAGSIE